MFMKPICSKYTNHGIWSRPLKNKGRSNEHLVFRGYYDHVGFRRHHWLKNQHRTMCQSVSNQDYMNVFDRTSKLLQKERAAHSPEVELFDYLKENIGEALADRLHDIKRKFKLMVDLGCGRGYISKHLTPDIVSELVMCDLSPTMLAQAVEPVTKGIAVKKMVINEEDLPFENDSVDLFVSCLSLHWVNDLPGAFNKIKSCLKNDGIFIAALFGCETLFELRCSLQLAQLEREGGVSAHVSPFTEVRDIGSLLTRAGFSMLTIDTEELVVSYPTMFELMRDLKGMGENNAARNRSTHLQRETMLAASAIYENLYGKDGKIPATFQVIYFIGWKPDPSQPQPAKRGSANVSLKNVKEVLEELEKNKDNTGEKL